MYLQGEHEGQCDYERITCEACQLRILLNEKDRHNERECEARTLNCKYCKVSFNFKDIKVTLTLLVINHHNPLSLFLPFAHTPLRSLLTDITGCSRERGIGPALQMYVSLEEEVFC